MTGLILRAVRPWGGPLCDVAVADGRVSALGPQLPRGGEEVAGRGDVLLPALADAHLHLLALAASRQSVRLDGLTTEAAIVAALRGASGTPFVRATGCDERAAGLPDASLLDRWLADRPLRVQDRTGALWVLNTAALRRLGPGELPPGAERDADGRPTGRFWREDVWLRGACPAALPDLAALGAELAAFGLGLLTDAGAGNGPGEARILAGALPQRLTLMGNESLPAGAGYALGPLKLLIDERDPPPPEALAARIAAARGQGRAVAAHCTTEAELALFLAALSVAGGARAGDRVEHGGLVPPRFLPLLAAAGLLVVTNPAFIHDRGERYRATVPAGCWEHLYPARSLMAAGVPVVAGSDAPYGAVDPWLGMRAARDRRTAAGNPVGPGQRLGAGAALGLYCRGSIAPGAPADLILCTGSMADVLADLDGGRVRLTLVGGRIVSRGCG